MADWAFFSKMSFACWRYPMVPRLKRNSVGFRSRKENQAGDFLTRRELKQAKQPLGWCEGPVCKQFHSFEDYLSHGVLRKVLQLLKASCCLVMSRTNTVCYFRALFTMTEPQTSWSSLQTQLMLPSADPLTRAAFSSFNQLYLTLICYAFLLSDLKATKKNRLQAVKGWNPWCYQADHW